MRIRLYAGMGLVALAIAALAAPAAQAKEIPFSLTLSGASETPPNDSKGTGTGKIVYDDKTMELSWNITFQGLSGDATMAHFHGPAKPGVAAGVEVGIQGPVKSPIVGKAKLTEAQAKDLMDGMFYFNIHTAAHPPGEIRGQLEMSGM